MNKIIDFLDSLDQMAVMQFIAAIAFVVLALEAYFVAEKNGKIERIENAKLEKFESGGQLFCLQKEGDTISVKIASKKKGWIAGESQGEKVLFEKIGNGKYRLYRISECYEKNPFER